jgi:hypothetical protein
MLDSSILISSKPEDHGSKVKIMSSAFSKTATAARLLFHHPQGLIIAAGSNGLLNYVPDIPYLKMVFKAETGYKLNLDNPQTYNEKLQWLKLYDRKPIYTIFADKYAVREYVKKTIGEEYLVPLIGVYRTPDEMKWVDLPQQFVLKITNGCGKNIICKDKSQLNIEHSVQKLSAWMKKSIFWGGREWAYKNIIPKIICEELIQTEDKKSPRDYKFLCFNGKPKLVQLHNDRYGNYTMDYYDIEWKKTEICKKGLPCSNEVAEKPVNFETMLDIARYLSKEATFARVDLYNERGRIIFGEITLYPNSGFSVFTDEKYDYLLGGWISLPKEKIF